MHTDLRLRAATADDWSAIWPIWHRVVAAGETYVWDPATDEKTARTTWMAPPPAAVFVAEHVLDEARRRGYRAMQFNAVVEVNSRAIALWQSLGFRIIGTVPGAFRHPVPARWGCTSCTGPSDPRRAAWCPSQCFAGRMWYSKTSPPTAMNTVIHAITSSQMYQKASAIPTSAHDAASAIGQ